MNLSTPSGDLFSLPSDRLSIDVSPQSLQQTENSTETPLAAFQRYVSTLPQLPSPREEIKSPSLWKGIRSEIIGTFLLTSFSSVTIIPFHTTVEGSSTSQSMAGSQTCWAWSVSWIFVHSLTMGTLAWSIRAAHLSLPITLSFFLTRKISLLRTVMHVIAQLVGCLLAAPVIAGLFPIEEVEPPAVLPSAKIVQAWGGEFLASLLVSLTSLSAYENVTFSRSRLEKQENKNVSFPVFNSQAVGPFVCSHFMAAFFSSRFTRNGVNPARAFSLAILQQTWKDQWIFWVGSSLGGLLGAFTYEYVGKQESTELPNAFTDTPLIQRDASRATNITSLC